MKEQTPEQIKIMDEIDARRREDDPGRRQHEFYTTYCRSMYLGHQWITQENGAAGYNRFVNKAETFNSDKDQPMLTIINRITGNTLRTAAATRPQKLDIAKSEPIGAPTVEGQANASILKMAAGSAIVMSHLLSNIQRSSFERHINGLHGFGFRYVKYGDSDVGIEGFDFEGHRLTLDPMNHSTYLMDHNYVIYTQSMTFDQAVRIYGQEVFDEAGIKKEHLPTMATLCPVECGMHRVSGGNIYANYAQQANTPSLMMTWAFYRDTPMRFNKLHVMADTGAGRLASMGGGGNRMRVLLSDPSGPNPYAGNGMPLGLNAGWDRSGSRFPISDVGLMVDDQIKTNVCASLWVQGMWDRTNATLVVDKTSLGNNMMDADDIWDQIREGLLTVQRGGDKNALPPQWLTTPPADPSAADGFRYFETATRDAGFQTDINQGITKSHVPSSTTQLAVDRSELPLDDRQNRDIEAYEAVIETAAMCMIGLGAAGSKTAVQMLRNAGMTDDQMSRLSQIDLELSPCRLRIAREHIVRRSRSRRAAELQYAMSSQAITPQMYRDAMADMDMPIIQDDKSAVQHIDEKVLRIVLGEPSELFPLEEYFPAFRKAIRAAQMEHSDDPEIIQRLNDALDNQTEFEQVMADNLAQLEGGGGGEQVQEAPSAAIPPELELSQVVGNQPF